MKERRKGGWKGKRMQANQDGIFVFPSNNASVWTEIKLDGK